MFDLTLINLTLVQELLKGEGEKSSKENIDIIYFSYTKNLTHFQENKIRITFSQHLFFMFIQKFQRVTTFFFRVQLKKKTMFFLQEHMQDSSLQKNKSYAIINYFIYIHCHPIEEGFATSFNIPFISKKRKYLLMWKFFLI